MLTQNEADRAMELGQIENRTPQEDAELKALREKFAGSTEITDPSTYQQV